VVLGTARRRAVRALDGRQLPKAAASALLALPAAVLTVGLLRAMAVGEAALAAMLLDDGQSTATN
jgi:hypothetical protein